MQFATKEQYIFGTINVSNSSLESDKDNKTNKLLLRGVSIIRGWY